MAEITRKQRANAERERGSKTCAGCDGPKARGTSFCDICTETVKKLPFERFAGFAVWYTDALNFLFEGHPAWVEARS